MKKNFVSLLLTLVVLAGLSSFNVASERANALKFSSMTYDFGLLEKGVPVSHNFEFSNPAGESIIITKVVASCGCTVTDYTKEAVAPGKSGFVKATYNAAKAGKFSKTVSVYHNAADLPITLTIKGEVAE